jgi:hypothetical protein
MSGFGRSVLAARYAGVRHGAGRREAPRAVLNSDAGQLMWTGILREDRAAAPLMTLTNERSWSGWGFRTLGGDAVRYNPVSYHNGSIWPHDTALFEAGLASYRFTEERARPRRPVPPREHVTGPASTGAGSRLSARPPAPGALSRRVQAAGLGRSGALVSGQ